MFGTVYAKTIRIRKKSDLKSWIWFFLYAHTVYEKNVNFVDTGRKLHSVSWGGGLEAFEIKRPATEKPASFTFDCGPFSLCRKFLLNIQGLKAFED